MWATRYWEGGSFLECDPVHTRRIYASQTHFDGHLLHDDFVRTLDPSEAKLFYVPTFVMQRHTWGGAGVHRSLLMALEHIRHAYPYWNASAGRDHVWFLPGEKQALYTTTLLHCYPTTLLPYYSATLLHCYPTTRLPDYPTTLPHTPSSASTRGSTSPQS